MQKNYNQLEAIHGLNYQPLTPVSFLRRAADLFPDHPAIIYGNRQVTWTQLSQRAKRLASALQKLGVQTGSTVAVIAANTPELVEAHYGIPLSGGVINAINTRLDADTVRYILEHGQAQVLITDTHFSPVVREALDGLDNPPVVVDIVDEQLVPPDGAGARLGAISWEELLATGSETADWRYPNSEWDALSLNYTSGTSGRPKGVVYHHRGSYLMSMGTIAAWQIPRHPRYLYTVPMFHCNGWGHVWAMAIMGGTFVCNRVITADVMFKAIEKHRITHFGAAPIILGLLANAPESEQKTMDYTVQVMTAGAPPPAKVLEKVGQLGFNVIHVYGLTESYGHVVYCDWREQWSALSAAEQAEIRARQGVRMPMMEAARVISVESGEPVPPDGETIGEIVLQGNTIMKGYYRDPKATAEAFSDGVFHSGDLAVVHPDGYIEIKDRLKDIIISGGENISSVEVESVLYRHPAVAAAAVVAKAHEKWGQTPCAFVELKPGATATSEDIIDFCRQQQLGFRRPTEVVFTELPKTATGKIQKFKLRGLVDSGLGRSGQ